MPIGRQHRAADAELGVWAVGGGLGGGGERGEGGQLGDGEVVEGGADGEKGGVVELGLCWGGAVECHGCLGLVKW